jgi:hypothetical protein
MQTRLFSVILRPILILCVHTGYELSIIVEKALDRTMD